MVVQVAGYIKKYENGFTFATVHGAGHEVRSLLLLPTCPIGWPHALPPTSLACLPACLTDWTSWSCCVVVHQVPTYKPEAALQLFVDYLGDKL